MARSLISVYAVQTWLTQHWFSATRSQAGATVLKWWTQSFKQSSTELLLMYLWGARKELIYYYYLIYRLNQWLTVSSFLLRYPVYIIEVERSRALKRETGCWLWSDLAIVAVWAHYVRRRLWRHNCRFFDFTDTLL